MLIGTNAPRPRRLPLTPLVDVVFLLVIFFVASSSFLAVGRIDLVPAPEETGAAADGGAGAAGGDRGGMAHAGGPDVLLSVRANGRLLVNGEPVPAGGLGRRLSQAVGDGARDVLVTAAPGADVERLALALAAARTAGFASVRVRAPVAR